MSERRVPSRYDIYRKRSRPRHGCDGSGAGTAGQLP
ncbi:hypothetical protein BJ987_002492 [Nocardia goodfellowii]|uniref:Uncharacterized protein n=1 Tax=Nocardia goodfellowii TaxID=882446 RepID=A0ABS4QD29_9NOCA|nr:hypothetical protein [Nocardia goodfellowii]